MKLTFFFNKRIGPLPLRINLPTTYTYYDEYWPEIVELTADFLNIFLFNVRVTGSVSFFFFFYPPADQCINLEPWVRVPQSFFFFLGGGSTTFILECRININILY